MPVQDVFDYEDSPEEPKTSDGSLRVTIILWLVAISGLILLVPLYFFSSTVRSDVDHIDATLQAAQATLASERTPLPTIQSLRDDLTQVEAAVDEIDAVRATLEAGHVNWPAVMAAIGNYNPARIALTSIAQSGREIMLRGRAVDDSAVVDYSHALEESDLFVDVVVRSVRLVATPFEPHVTEIAESDVTETATATVTPTVTVTPTPDPADAYEVDDFEPQPIFIGEPQYHNFYPLYDVDRVQFLAKAGRYYRVSTMDLSPGVDTFLSVAVGSNTYLNDDQKAGVLSSRVTFKIGSKDTVVTVRISNRGQDGADKGYWILVEEVVPTPRPTATPTATPEDTPTPTPDLHDPYEPNDVNPKPIAVGEVQVHNFYPDDDTDVVKFLAKAGRWYRVSTSDLSTGIDTFLSVSVDDAVYTNDDVQPGYLRSQVVFRVDDGYDVQAVAKVTNRGQYGPTKWYQIAVEEVIPTPTPTSTPTPTATPEDIPPPTRDLRDSYEPDDAIPKPLAIGEEQTHNFYPDNDVDLVQFLAKTGRWYRVYTLNLAQRVDTVLTVDLEDAVYVNDDRGAGDLSSEVVLYNDAGYDLDVLVQVTNRGQYGPDESYQITVKEIVPTPTPTPTSTVPADSSLRPPGMSSSTFDLSCSNTSEDANAVEFVILVELKVESP